MRSTPPAPPERSYWADPGRLLAGAYPGDAHPDRADRRLRALLGAGARTFVNLMEPDERDHGGRLFVAYEPRVEALAREIGIEATSLRFPIRDLGIPSAELLQEILASIDASLARGHPVYVHCWGGRGRTGTVVGSYLIRHAIATPANVIDVIARLRRNDSGGGPSPETAAQIELVRMSAAFAESPLPNQSRRRCGCIRTMNVICNRPSRAGSLVVAAKAE